MVKEILENGDKVVRIAEDIQYSGTLPIIMSIMLLVILGLLFFWGSKLVKVSVTTMREIGHATKEMAESIRALVEENIKKSEAAQRNNVDFNVARKLHAEELKRVTEMAKNVDKTLEKVEEKQDSMAMDVSKILTILKVR